MPIEVFHRCEKKYIITSNQFLSMQDFLRQYMIPDKYNKNNGAYQIVNLYYDTVDNHLIRTSIDKPYYKEKLRLRSYGVPKPHSVVFLELKKKLNSVTYKRRTMIKLSDAYDFINNDIVPKNCEFTNKQILNEIRYFNKIYNVVEKMKLTYERVAFFSSESASLRVSFDNNIFYNTTDLLLESGERGKRLLNEGYYIMEIKTESEIPLWLSKYLSENKIFSTGFSKYGAGHKRELSNTLEEDEQCLIQQQEPLLTKLLL